MLLSWKGQRQLLGAPGQVAFRQEIGNTEPQKPYAAATRLGCRQKPWQLGKHIFGVEAGMNCGTKVNLQGIFRKLKAFYLIVIVIALCLKLNKSAVQLATLAFEAAFIVN